MSITGIASQARGVPRPVYLWWAVTAVAFGVIIQALRLAGVDVLLLTRDPDAVSGLGSDVGSLSMIGLAMWAGTAAAFGLTGAVVRPGRRRRFLLATAALVAWLLLDDAIMIHDVLLPTVGVPDAITYAIYSGLALVWLRTFRREIARTEVGLLFVAGGAFALAIVCDVADRLPVFEDYAKLVGIATLLLYAFRSCRAELRHPA